MVVSFLCCESQRGTVGSLRSPKLFKVYEATCLSPTDRIFQGNVFSFFLLFFSPRNSRCRCWTDSLCLLVRIFLSLCDNTRSILLLARRLSRRVASFSEETFESTLHSHSSPRFFERIGLERGEESFSVSELYPLEGIISNSHGG